MTKLCVHHFIILSVLNHAIVMIFFLQAKMQLCVLSNPVQTTYVPTYHIDTYLSIQTPHMVSYLSLCHFRSAYSNLSFHQFSLYSHTPPFFLTPHLFILFLFLSSFHTYYLPSTYIKIDCVPSTYIKIDNVPYTHVPTTYVTSTYYLLHM